MTWSQENTLWSTPHPVLTSQTTSSARVMKYFSKFMLQTPLNSWWTTLCLSDNKKPSSLLSPPPLPSSLPLLRLTSFLLTSLLSSGVPHSLENLFSPLSSLIFFFPLLFSTFHKSTFWVVIAHCELRTSQVRIIHQSMVNCVMKSCLLILPDPPVRPIYLSRGPLEWSTVFFSIFFLQNRKKNTHTSTGSSSSTTDVMTPVG